MIAISSNATPVSFEWEFDREQFDAAQAFNDRNWEDDIFGWVVVTHDGKQYIVDVHRYYYSVRDTGYVLEVFREAPYGGHGSWRGSIHEIRAVTAKHDPLGHFKKRAEKLIAEFLACPANC